MASLPYSIKPDRIKVMETAFDTTIVQFENRAEQRFCNHETEMASFSLSWYFLNQVQVTALRTFFKARMGAYEAWTFENHHEITSVTAAGVPIYKTYKVRFKDDKLVFKYFNQKWASCECEVIQCL